MDFSKLEKSIGITFTNKELLKQAFVHRSYLNENRSQGLEHNERLEFLGDTVLQFVATEFLFNKFKDLDEGVLTSVRARLVNADNCALVAEKLGFEEFILMSKGEKKQATKSLHYTLANALEAFIGALFLDQGLEVAKKFVNQHITPSAEIVLAEGSWIDAKSLLQTKAQEFEGVTPIYKTLKETGPAHDRHFSVGVFIGEKKLGTGEGDSKQEAEQEAARKALKAKGWG